MSEFYIGNRLDPREINKALGQSLPKLNNKMAETLRSVAMKQGIKKTQQGARLEFYAVSKEQLDTLTKASTQTFMALKGVEWRPLITVDAKKMTEALRKVNARYTGGMDYKTHQKYLKELEAAVEDSLHKIAEDTKTVKQPSRNPLKGNINNVQVGDIIHVRLSNYARRGELVRITKTTEKSFWYEKIMPHGEVISNPDYALAHFKDVQVTHRSASGHNFTIPYLPNKDAFKVVNDYYGKPTVGMKRWDGEKVSVGYVSDLDYYGD
jgi:hypothetical protein